jgi:hypothetical protein
MAISIDYLTNIIFVPRADLVEIQNTPSFVYQLNLEAFYREVADLQDDSLGMAYQTAVVNTAPVNVGGVLLARVIQIINGYTVEFEDGQYAVNLTGANTNLQDVAIVNQVSIRPNNSAGLQDLGVLLQAAYGGRVYVDELNGQTGTVIPLGTRGLPVNNFDDALLIAQNNSLRGIHIMGAGELGSTNFGAGFIFYGDSAAVTTLTILPGAGVSNCDFEEITIQGTMDGNNTFRNCRILDIDYTNGFIYECALDGVIALGGNTQCSILDCWSNVVGTGVGAHADIDMGGSGNSLALRNYSGGIELRNFSGGGGEVSVDMASGRVVIAATVTAGAITIRGIADVEDNSTGTAVVTDATVNETLDQMLTGQGLISSAIDFVRKLLSNKVAISSDDLVTTVYDDDNTTPIQVFDHPDVRNRTPR